MQVQFIGVGSGAAGAALAAPIFCLVAVLGPRFFRYAICLFYNSDIEILRARFARGCFFKNSFIINNVKCWVLNIERFKKTSVRGIQGEKRVKLPL